MDQGELVSDDVVVGIITGKRYDKPIARKARCSTAFPARYGSRSPLNPNLSAKRSRKSIS